MKDKSIIRNNILSAVLFALTALFPTLYVLRRLFLPGYTVIFDGRMICADVLNIIMISICTAMLIFKDKRVGSVAKVLLIVALILLPVGRFLLFTKTEVYPGNVDTLIYLAAIGVLIVTVWKYVNAPYLMILEIIAFCILMGFTLVFSMFSLMFSYGYIGNLADIPSPDGVHHVRVVEYADDDVKDYRHKAVYVYNAADSFSVGPMEFMKDWHFIESTSEKLDVNKDIVFKDNETITVKRNTYTYDGEKVTEPPEPPL